MRILASINKNNSSAYHRIITPLALMGVDDIHITNNILKCNFANYDIFMYSRVSVLDYIDQIKEFSREMGFKICLDIDDFWEVDPHHIAYAGNKEGDYVKEQVKHIMAADVILTTHSRLAAEIKPFNKNVYVLPNAIPRCEQFCIETIPHHLTRLFWQGSVTHEEDIKLLQRPIECLNKIAGKIKMVMAGVELDPEEEVIDGKIMHLTHSDVWYNMGLDYTANTKHQYKLIAGLPITDYYKAYAHADICLIPLLNTKFNSMKSNLKVLEAANLSLPVICSPVHPYLGLPVIYAAGTKGWVSNITRLVESKDYQKEAGAELKEFCDIHFDFHKINRERRQILEHTANLVTK